MKRKIRLFLNKILQPIGYKLQPRTINPFKARTASRLAQFQLFEKVFDRIRAVEGDIVECGVGGGGSLFLLAYLTAVDEQHDRLVWAFDSFAGFPEPTAEDASARNPKKGDWGDVSIALINELFAGSDLPRNFIDERLKVVPGFFNKTLPAFPNRPIAVLHVDADLYESYRDVFTHLAPRLNPGAVVVFDEYANKMWPGATKAVDEFIAQSNKKLVHDERSGKHYMIW